MKSIPNIKQPRVDEPEIEYQQKEFDIFNSFEDENNATAELSSILSPEENFKLAHRMIKAMYKKELEDMPVPPYSRITFTMIDGLPV